MFAPMTDDLRTQITDLIIGGVNDFFPTVVINSLNIEFNQEASTAIINLNYSVINTNIEDEIQININNGRV